MILHLSKNADAWGSVSFLPRFAVEDDIEKKKLTLLDVKDIEIRCIVRFSIIKTSSKQRDGEIYRVCSGGQLRENTAMDKKKIYWENPEQDNTGIYCYVYQDKLCGAFADNEPHK